MAAKDIGSIHDIGADILSSEISSNGAISVQYGDSVNEEVRGDGAEWWQHVGFASRPSNATSGSPSCQAVVIDQSDYPVVVASRDLRSASLAGQLGPGETAVYAAGPDGQGSPRVYLSSKSTSDESIIIKVKDTTITVKQDGSVVIDAQSITLGNTNTAQPLPFAAALFEWIELVKRVLNNPAVQGVAPSAVLAAPFPDDLTKFNTYATLASVTAPDDTQVVKAT